MIITAPRWWRTGWPALSVAMLALLASVTSLGNGFAYDDRWIIAENTRAHTIDPLHIFAETYWPTIRGAALYRPLTILLYAVQWVVGHGAPLIYHVVNVALYAGITVLVFWFARQFLSLAAAWVAAALFAVHPVHVEAVANVVGQAELWTTLAMVGAVALYVHDRRDGAPLRRQSAFVIAGLYALGLLVKENTIVLPALLIVAEWCLVQDPRPEPVRLAEWRPWPMTRHAPPGDSGLRPLVLWLGLCAALFLWVRVDVLSEIGGDVSHPSLHGLGMGQRAWLMVGLLPEFGRLFVWPAHLYADYSPRQVPIMTHFQVALLPGLLLLGCLTILAAVSWRRAPVVTFGLAWLVLTIAPVSNILIPTGILIAERTLFSPSVGVVLVVACATPWVLAQLHGRPRLVVLAAGATLALLLTLGIAQSAERQYVWKDSNAVFRALASDAPANFKAHYVYGGQLFEQKRAVEGEREWRMAIALLPEYYGVRVDLAHKYREAHVCQAAIPEYQRALVIEPALPLARAGLVACYLELAQWRHARAEARSAIADGFYRRAFTYMIERADSALAAADSLDPTNRWSGKGRVVKP